MLGSKNAKPRLDLSAAEKTRTFALRYKLTYHEAYEAFYLLSDRWGKTVRFVVLGALGVAALVCLVLVIIDPTALQYSMLIVACALLMMLVLYWPALKAKRGARAVARTDGTYQYVLSHRRGIVLSSGKTVPLQGDPDARAIETDVLFAVRPDRDHTFCIPKRILKEEEVSTVRRLLYSGIRHTRLRMPADTYYLPNEDQSAGHAVASS